MKIKLHKHLDEKIWDDKEHLNPKVSDMLLSIAWAYIDYVRNEYGMNIRNCDIKDIFVFGSITQFFYDKQSDIDICIVLNLDEAQRKYQDSEIGKMLKLYYYDWAMVHICKIYGRKIDLNFCDEKNPEFNGRYRTGPMYSLINKEWIVKPCHLSQNDMIEIERKSAIVYKKIFHDYKIIKRNGFKLDEINRFYSNLIFSKKKCFSEDCEQVINPVYMAIRKFKHNGYIKKLRNKAVQKETEKYVLK